MGARGGAREHANSRIRGYSSLWAGHVATLLLSAAALHHARDQLAARDSWLHKAALARHAVSPCRTLPSHLLAISARSVGSLPVAVALFTYSLRHGRRRRRGPAEEVVLAELQHVLVGRGAFEAVHELRQPTPPSPPPQRRET